MESPVLVLAPRDLLPKRLPLVLSSLRGEGVEPLLLRDLAGEAPAALVPEAVVEKALSRVREVLVVPRRRGSIGAGTLRDLRLAERSGKPVSVLDPKGRTWPLSECVVKEQEEGSNHRSVVAAHIRWPKKAGSTG